jgi:hypothetical protein
MSILNRQIVLKGLDRKLDRRGSLTLDRTMTNEELFTEAARIFSEAAELLGEYKRAETIEEVKRFERYARQERDCLPESARLGDRRS